MWSRKIAAAVVALVAVTAGYLAFNHEEAPVNDQAQAVNDKPENHGDRSRDTLNMSDHGPVPMILSKPQLLALHHQEEAQPVQTTQESQESLDSHEEQTDRPQNQEDRSRDTLQRRDHGPVPVIHRQTLDEPSEIRKPAASDSRLMAMVYLSNGLSGVSDAKDYGKYYVEADHHPMYSNTGETSHHSQEVNHRLPVRMGLSLRYRLNDKWSLESGLAYTRLISDYKTVSSHERVNTEQTLSYVGIPVTASYQLWQSRYINFYVSGGGMVEKMVKGRLHHEFVTARQERTESLSIRPLQFSVNGSVGAAFNLNRLFSIYAEPGVGYYFDNGSNVPTYYQENPFSFNLNVGLRFNIK